MRYGLPYKGSKNAIAEWIVSYLPKADVFCDLFFGGGAITHRANKLYTRTDITNEYGDMEDMQPYEEALDMAIKALEQESKYYPDDVLNCWIGKEVLFKIRAEIEQLTSRYSISKERGGMGQVEWSDRLIKESDVLQIIDKYKAESEDKK